MLHGGQAVLERIDLTASRFIVAEMQVVHFDGCVLDFADFSAAQLQFAEVANVRAKGVDFEFAQAPLLVHRPLQFPPAAPAPATRSSRAFS